MRAMDFPQFILLCVLLLLIVIAFRHAPRPRRGRRRPAFKKRHGLDRRQPLAGFDRKLATAMFDEGKEVFVTAFCTDDEVVAVTATVGTARRCRPSDRVENWGMKASRLGATQIRQYHNHPDVLGRSIPSGADRRSHQYLRACVEPYGVRFHSLLIYKPWLGSYTVKEYA